MAILARVASHGITSSMDLIVTVQFFDDNDPLNQGITPPGVTPVVEPGAVLQVESWTYPPTLNGLELQAALAADIRKHGHIFVRARTASVEAVTMVPVGALVNVEA